MKVKLLTIVLLALSSCSIDIAGPGNEGRARIAYGERT